jgi:hypothetical protein
MKWSIFIALIALLTISCYGTKPATKAIVHTSQTAVKTNTSDHDGSSIEKAIIIEEKTESTGVNAEYAWIDKHYPGSKTNSQSLLEVKNVPYDVIEVRTAEHKEIKIYFDISNYFGKF